jgi:xylulokinase
LPAQARAGLGNPLVAGMTGPMLSWVAASEPDVLAAATVALLPKDYVRSVLGGPPCTERSDASATLLWDVGADGWATAVVAELGLPGELLPEVRDSAAVVTQTRWPGAAHDVPVVVGAADTAAALLAGGGLAPGAVQVNLGSGAQVLGGVDTPEPVADPATHLYADPVGGWYAMAAIRNAGLALDRVRQLLDLSWEALFGLAEAAAPGAGGVSFLPFLSGERGGVAGPSSHGAWLGLDERTTRAELARAALEGMVFCVRRGVDLVGARPQQVRLSGGGARSAAVRQALADLLGAELELVPARSASAIGAAMLAAQGAGSPLPVTSRATSVVSPEAAPELQAAYEQWVERLPSADA